ncbi:hypothetical protein ACOKM3_01995 [Streptomyces sp. BH106]|uniref:hypothetical protein n=1 Tax=Streptomyces sp. BH106 TaxID=3410409 RepID=UPI003CEBD044
MAHSRIVVMVPLVAVGALLAGCSSGGGSTSPSRPATAASSSSSAGPSRPAPAPTESNPPGDIPDNQVYVPYAPAQGGFSVKVPEGWSRSKQGAGTVFTDKLNSVTVRTTSAATAPSVRSVTGTVVPQLRTPVTRLTGAKASVVKRHSGDVVRLTYQRDSEKNPVTGKVVRDAVERYAFYRGGHEVDVTLSGPVNADNVDPWRIISDSFTWK